MHLAPWKGGECVAAVRWFDRLLAQLWPAPGAASRGRSARSYPDWPATDRGKSILRHRATGSIHL